MRIRELLDKIRWDHREVESEYEIQYLDRFHGPIHLTPDQIDHVEAGFMYLAAGAQVPLHRIQRVLHNGEVVWEKRSL